MGHAMNERQGDRIRDRSEQQDLPLVAQEVKTTIASTRLPHQVMPNLKDLSRTGPYMTRPTPATNGSSPAWTRSGCYVQDTTRGNRPIRPVELTNRAATEDDDEPIASRRT